MTVVKPKILKEAQPNPGSAYAGPSDKEIADLQVKKAGLVNDISTAYGQLKILHAQSVDLQKKIAVEQKLYDSMVLQTTAEMQAELEKKVAAHQVILAELEKKLETVTIEIEKQTKFKDRLLSEIKDLDTELQKKQNSFAEEIKKSQSVLSGLNDQISSAQTELNIILVDSNKAKKEAEHAKADTVAYRIQQNDYAAFLDRKARDLAIWEKRLMPAFKEKYPDGEMKFV